MSDPIEQPLDPEQLAYQEGQVFLYPTEAVFGLGCDPNNEAAVEQLLAIKKRPRNKGLILVAKNYSQVMAYVDDAAIPIERRADIFSSWPGPVTWLLPKSASAPQWITGDFDKIAIRIPKHPVVERLCEKLGPLVSTSANITGMDTADTIAGVRQQLQAPLFVVDGELGERRNPSKIIDAVTGTVIRDNQ